MIPGSGPFGGAPFGAILNLAVVTTAVPAPPVGTQPNDPGVWMAEITVSSGGGVPVGPPPASIVPLGTWAMPSGDRPGAGPDPVVPKLRLSDRGWVGEPLDSVYPNVLFLPRLAEPPALEQTIPLYPDAPRRLASSAGELRMVNADQALDELAGDWSVAGREVVIYRGPHRRPRHSPFTDFVTVARMRASAAAVGTSVLSLPLRPVASDLTLQVCNTYSGTGGQEGPSGLAGQPKPKLYGLKRNFDPVLVDTGLLAYQLHDGPMQSVIEVRDRGVPLTFGANFATYSALAGASVAAGTYSTCLAAGFIRVGATPSLLTVDAQGDNDASTGGYAGGTASSIARKLIQGPGGVAAVDGARFLWQAGETGLYLLGGTVAEALDAIAAGVFGWWGTDRNGQYIGGQISAPETMVTTLSIEPRMVASPPIEVGTPRPPWWRVRVGYRAFARTQTGEQLAGSVTAANRELYGRATTLYTVADIAVSSAYPLAEDVPEIVSAYDTAGDAQALAEKLLALFKKPRRLFQVAIRPGAGGFAWPTLEIGACLLLKWPYTKALAAGRPVIVQGISVRGDAVTLTLWG